LTRAAGTVARGGGAGGFPAPIGLLIGVALFGVAMGGLYPAIALALTDSGEASASVGLVTAAYYAGSILGTVGGATVIARLGRRRAFAAVALTAATATALLAAVPDGGSGAILGIALLRAVAGGAFGIYYLAVESWIAGLATTGNRGRALGLYETVRVGAVAAGPLVLAGMAPGTGFVLAAVLIAVAIVPIRRVPAGDADTVTILPRLDCRTLRRLVATSPAGFAAAFAAGVTGASFYAYGPLFGRAVAGDGPLGAAFFSVVLLAPIVVHVAVGAASDRIGRRGALGAVSLAAATAAGALAVIGPEVSYGIALALALAAGAASHPLYALGLAHVNDRISPEHRLAAGTAILLAYNAGTVTGPGLTAASVAAMGIGGLYPVVAAVCALVALSARPDRTASA